MTKCLLRPSSSARTDSISPALDHIPLMKFGVLGRGGQRVRNLLSLSPPLPLSRIIGLVLKVLKSLLKVLEVLRVSKALSPLHPQTQLHRAKKISHALPPPLADCTWTINPQPPVLHLQCCQLRRGPVDSTSGRQHARGQGSNTCCAKTFLKVVEVLKVLKALSPPSPRNPTPYSTQSCVAPEMLSAPARPSH